MEQGFEVKVICSGTSGVASNFSLKNYKSKYRGQEHLQDVPAHLKAFPAPDTEGILKGCDFIKSFKSFPEKKSVTEAQLAVDILAHAAGTKTTASKALCFEYLDVVPELNASKVQAMVDRSSEYGPRSCASIHMKCGNESKCLGCAQWGKIVSPIMIRGTDYIATESTGFHFLVTGKNGTVSRKPDYEGLRRFFYREHPYITIVNSATTFRWTGTHWQEVFDAEMQGFAQDHFKPLAKSSMTNEFMNLVGRTERKPHDFFNDTTTRKMNFQNGVLDIDSGEFTRHSVAYGFRHVLPYAYDPTAVCPRFEQFLEEVTLRRQELIDILLEFAGYSLSNDKCWEQKALVLQGEGRNGKSKLVSVIKALAGDGNSTALTLVDLEKDANRYALDGSLFNIAEETPSKSLMDSSLFKNLVSGGEVSVKQLYKQPYTIRNRAKFWLLCNDMPRTFDKSYAMFRRLVIVPFEATFVGEKEDKHIEEKLFAELPGIFNLVIAHYKKMRDRKSLPDSEISTALVEGYKIENDNVARWFGECIEVLKEGSEYDSGSQELYNSYRLYCENEGEKFCTAPSFYKRLSNHWRPYRRCSIQRRAKPGCDPERRIQRLRIVLCKPTGY